MSSLAVFVLMSALACGIVYAALGRTAWWVPAFAFSFLGGYINIGFKIYPHEIGMGLSLIALSWFVASKPRRVSGRPPLDWSFYVLLAYMLGHLAVSCYLALAAGMPGTGTIFRLYVNGLWGIVFATLFWAYGDLRHFRIALVLATVFCIITVVLGVLAIRTSDTTSVQEGRLLLSPTANYLRGAGLSLMVLLTVWFYRRTRTFARGVIISVYVASVFIALLGSGRVAALSALVTPFMWGIVQRRRSGVLVGIVGVASVLAVINYSADIYGSLPDGARRALSTFVVTRDVEEHYLTADSDEWHFMLLESGGRRWTQSLATFTFGNKVEGWREGYYIGRWLEENADIAARLASYENGFFTVTATLGIVGLLLFARAIYWLYRPFTQHILRNGIRGEYDALEFIAVQSLVIYVGLIWIAGGYPSSPVLLGTLAAVSFYDRRSASREELDRSIVGAVGMSRFRQKRRSVLGRGWA